MARSAAKKHATPPECESDVIDDNNKDNTSYFCTKVLPNALPLDDLKRKILEKNTVEESQLQIAIIENIRKLNTMLINKKPIELFRDHSCSQLYRQILDLQISQNFASAAWKIVGFAVLVPMTGNITLFGSAIFHTKKCDLFFSWTKDQKNHFDMNLAPSTNLFSDNSVESATGLVNKPTQYTKNDNDWSISENLENLNDSLNSIESKSSSIDSGKTIAEPIIPVMNCHDFSQIDGPGDETTRELDSYLDISFLNVKRRMDLTKQEKLNILDGPSSVHSTPLNKNILHPRLGTSLKKQNSRPQTNVQPSYVTRFLNRWFRSQIDQMSNELQLELSAQRDME